jgi:hypothetical protein
MGPLDADVSSAIRCEGRQMFEQAGESGVDQCPYPIRDNRRTAWYEGYFEERTTARLGRAITTGSHTGSYDAGLGK